MSEHKNFDTVLRACCDRWSLSNPVLKYESPLANVYRVALPSGGAGALKIFSAYGLIDEWDGVLLLEWYAGIGAAEVLAIGDGALLMKWIDGGSLAQLCYDGRAEEAAVILARLALKDRRQDTPAPALKTIEQRFEHLFHWGEAGIPAEYAAVFREAKTVAARLLRVDQQYIPLHGDIHFENALFDGEEWRLIDPKGLMGPPAYEYANMFMNPWSRPEIVFAKGRARSLAEVLSAETGLPAVELIEWAIAHCALAATWLASGATPVEHPLKLLEILFDTRDALD